MEKHYKPLESGLTVRESNIDGLGLFATREFPKGHNFGISHVKNDNFQDGYIRTPLGGFYNHSEDPNCKSIIKENYKCLISIKKIRPEDELTVEYTLYEPIR